MKPRVVVPYLRQSRLAGVFIAAALTIAVTGGLTLAEVYSISLRSALTRLTGHAWVTKTVLTGLLFPAVAVVAYRALASRPVRRAIRADSLWRWAVVLIGVTTLFTVLSMLARLERYWNR